MLTEHRHAFLRLVRSPDSARVDGLIRLELAAASEGITWDRVECPASGKGTPEEPSTDANDPWGVSRAVDAVLGLDDASCRVCGCTADSPCPGGCEWVYDPAAGDLCSSCADLAWEVGRQLAAGELVSPADRATYDRWLDLPEPEPARSA